MYNEDFSLKASGLFALMSKGISEGVYLIHD